MAKQTSNGAPRAAKPRKSAAAQPTPAKSKPNPPSSGDWRARTLAEVRRLIHEADPEIVEERKWVKPSNPSGVPTWSRGGIVCTGETYKEVVKLTFARGAALPDPHRLFNAGLEGNARRAIDLREGEALGAEAFKDLIRAAVEANVGRAAARKR
jgi:hypothetical protein